MKKHSSDLLKRTVSGAILVGAIVMSILSTEYAFVSVFGLILLLIQVEFCSLLNNGKENIKCQMILWLIGSLILYLVSYLVSSARIQSIYYIIYISFFLVVFLFELFRESENPIQNLANFSLSQIYIALPFSVLNYIYFIDNRFVLLVFILLWTYDVGAYLIGSLIGKHKLIERISPKKTWEGFVGGMLVTFLLTYICSVFVPELSIYQWGILAILVVLLGTLGDLMESIIKRTVGVKDSGNLLPGHGGFFDRFDSLLFLTPIVWFLLLIWF